MKKTMSFFWLVALFALLGSTLPGCAKKALDVGEGASVPVEQAAVPTEEIGQAAGEGPVGVEEPGIGESVIPAEGSLAGRAHEVISEGRTSGPMLPVYFDFDRFSIRDDMKSRMEANALFLLDHPEIRIEIQGNCDERGTNEYNLALGEKRAKSTKQYLVNLGASADRIETVSFGEERPLDPGHTEESWSKNRRADFVIIK